MVFLSRRGTDSFSLSTEYQSFVDTLFSSVRSTFVPSGYVSKYIYSLDFSCCFLPLSVVVYPCTFSHFLNRYHASMLVCHV